MVLPWPLGLRAGEARSRVAGRQGRLARNEASTRWGAEDGSATGRAASAQPPGLLERIRHLHRRRSQSGPSWPASSRTGRSGMAWGPRRPSGSRRERRRVSGALRRSAAGRSIFPGRTEGDSGYGAAASLNRSFSSHSMLCLCACLSQYSPSLSASVPSRSVARPRHPPLPATRQAAGAPRRDPRRYKPVAGGTLAGAGRHLSLTSRRPVALPGCHRVDAGFRAGCRGRPLRRPGAPLVAPRATAEMRAPALASSLGLP